MQCAKVKPEKRHGLTCPATWVINHCSGLEHMSSTSTRPQPTGKQLPPIFSLLCHDVFWFVLTQVVLSSLSVALNFIVVQTLLCAVAEVRPPFPLWPLIDPLVAILSWVAGPVPFWRDFDSEPLDSPPPGTIFILAIDQWNWTSSFTVNQGYGGSFFSSLGEIEKGFIVFPWQPTWQENDKSTVVC